MRTRGRRASSVHGARGYRRVARPHNRRRRQSRCGIISPYTSKIRQAQQWSDQYLIDDACSRRSSCVGYRACSPDKASCRLFCPTISSDGNSIPRQGLVLELDHRQSSQDEESESCEVSDSFTIQGKVQQGASSSGTIRCQRSGCSPEDCCQDCYHCCSRCT